MVGSDDHQTGKLALRAAVGLQRHARKSRDFGEVLFQFLKHGPGATRLVGWTKRVQLCERRPRDGDEFRGRVELHGARPQWDHGVGQAQVLVLELFDVPHHLGFRAVAVEHRVVQVIDLTGDGPKEGCVELHALHRAHTQGGAQGGKVVGVGALVQGDPHVFAVGEIAQVDALGFGPGTECVHCICPTRDVNFQGVEVALVDHGQTV